MSRLFYTCPIKAAYMAKEFGVRYNVKVEGGSEWITYMSYDMSKSKQVDQVTTAFIIAPESEDIFEPREGDLGLYVNYPSKFTEIGWVSYTFATGSKIDGSKIIMRNNKNFFMPEVENG